LVGNDKYSYCSNGTCYYEIVTRKPSITVPEQQDNHEKPSFDPEIFDAEFPTDDDINRPWRDIQSDIEKIKSSPSVPDTARGQSFLILYLIIAGVILAVVVFVVIGIVYKKRRQRAALIAAYANQANQECAQTNTQNPYNRF